MNAVYMKKRFPEPLRKPLNITVGILAVIALGAVGAHYFIPPISPGFLVFPVVVALHVIPAGFWMLLAPFQFVRRIRSRWLNYHRWTGRVLVALGLLIGLSALFMGWIIPVAGWPERVIIGFYGAFFLVALGKGFYHIRVRQTMLHREWMIRAFALTLAVATIRLIEIPLLIAVGTASLQIIYIIGNITAFTSHAVIAEIWIRATRSKKQVLAADAAEMSPRSQMTTSKL